MLKIKLKKQYEKYPEYKNSGVEWLEKVPKGWGINKAKTFVKFKTSGVWGDDAKGDSNDLPCLRVADFDYDKFTFKKVETIRNIPKNQQWKILKKSDILIEKSGGGEKQPVGRTIIFDSDEKIVCANFIDKVEVNTNVVPKFLTYLFSVAYSIGLNLKSIKQNTGIQNLDLTNYFNELFPQPLKPDQQKIADYLDEKVELIDNIREKKKKLIELLKEKRSAVINKAVTKGLDENVEIKDSGVEWIGEIPKGWEVKKLKRVCKFEYGESLSELNRDEGDIDVYGSNGIVGKHDKSITEGESIIIGRKGSAGRMQFSKSSCFPIDTTFYIDKNKTENNLRWLFYILSTLKLDITSKESTVPGLGRDDAYNKIIIYPSIKEQEKISNFLDGETEKIDNLMQKIEKSINLLSEYKSSLISGVVTGKIKV